MSQRDGAPARRNHRSGWSKARFRKFLSASMAGMATGLVRLICATLRIRCVDEDRFLAAKGGRILCMWHSRTIPPAARYRGEDITILISLSRDGDLIAKILATLGYPALRGSSGASGARVLASCIKLLRSGRTLAVTPDGPRGPSGTLQGGVMAMARKSGATLVPVGSSARQRVTMRSWDRFMLPLPFARAIMVFGEPVTVPQDTDDETLEAMRLSFEKEMRRLQDEADRRLRMATFAEIAAKRPLA